MELRNKVTMLGEMLSSLVDFYEAVPGIEAYRPHLDGLRKLKGDCQELNTLLPPDELEVEEPVLAPESAEQLAAAAPAVFQVGDPLDDARIEWAIASLLQLDQRSRAPADLNESLWRASSDWSAVDEAEHKAPNGPGVPSGPGTARTPAAASTQKAPAKPQSGKPADEDWHGMTQFFE